MRFVGGTNIFARGLERGRQLLVYKMVLDADGDLAMVLPIPVPPKSAEDAVTFIDMSSAPDFFRHLDALFPAELTRSFGAPAPAFAPQSKARLVVHDVGEFEASFVPTIGDFDRLDPRFRMAPDVWSKLPQYADYGFCVFKLKPQEAKGIVDQLKSVFGGRPPRKYHPMAFEFPRRDPSKTFFPTVHVHDGAVHETAAFDHSLFLQGATSPGWRQSSLLAGTMPAHTHRFVDREARVARCDLHGIHPNIDTIV